MPKFEEVESSLRHRARRALIALCLSEGPEACEMILDQALGRIRRKEEADMHHALDSLPQCPEHAALNYMYARQRHQDRQYRRDG